LKTRGGRHDDDMSTADPADPTTPDALALIERLDVGQIRQRLRELEQQSRALRVLLRAAVARERRSAADKGGPDRAA
jgi:hypothetical protein